MRIPLLFIGLFLLSVTLNGQTLIVKGKTTLAPISDVVVIMRDGRYLSKTNPAGIVFLQLEDTAELILQHAAYKSLVITISPPFLKQYEYLLDEMVLTIDEVVVSANKWEQNVKEIPNQIISFERKEIAQLNPQTTADILSNSGEIFVQKSQLGGGSPMIRGFAANSVLIMVDGVRMNNAIYRSGNLHNIISIDPNSIARSEVILGPSSVNYGSDALGGVMDFHSIEPSVGNNSVTANALLRTSSSNFEKTGHVDFTFSQEKWGVMLSSSFSDFDDLTSGKKMNKKYPDFGLRPEYVAANGTSDQVIVNPDFNDQKFSGYSQFNGLAKIKYRLSGDSELLYSLYHGSTSDIPRYDRLTQYDGANLKYAQWYYGPQIWNMHSIRYSDYKARKLYNQVRITAAFQNVSESRHDRLLGASSLNNREENVKLFSLNLDADKVIGIRELYYGAEITSNFVNSDASSYDINTGQYQPLGTRYPDGGSTYSSLAAYASMKLPLSSKIIANLGARFTQINLFGEFDNTSFYNLPFNKIELQTGALSGNAGLVINPNAKLQVNFLMSSGFRAPNIDDASKIFDSEPGTVIVPNIDLRPEHSLNSEVGVIFRSDQITFQSTVFHSLLFNAMVRRPFSLNGADSIFYEGSLSQVQALVNTGSARIYGASGKLQFNITDHFRITSTINYTKGSDLEDNSPLRHTTPLFGKTELTYNNEKFSLSLNTIYNGARPFDELPLSEKNKPHIYSPNGSLAWATLNYLINYELTKQIIVSAKIENIFDLHYRSYSSGISAPGRNFVVSIRSGFSRP